MSEQKMRKLRKDEVDNGRRGEHAAASVTLYGKHSYTVRSIQCILLTLGTYFQDVETQVGQMFVKMVARYHNQHQQPSTDGTRL